MVRRLVNSKLSGVNLGGSQSYIWIFDCGSQWGGGQPPPPWAVQMSTVFLFHQTCLLSLRNMFPSVVAFASSAASVLPDSQDKVLKEEEERPGGHTLTWSVLPGALVSP